MFKQGQLNATLSSAFSKTEVPLGAHIWEVIRLNPAAAFVPRMAFGSREARTFKGANNEVDLTPFSPLKVCFIFITRICALNNMTSGNPD